ncbi:MULTISPECIES: hypothetical protein [Streptomyces]|uniref:hypothetical protein n=1 Tax=Streptomyces scabiei TaxID=1930 RepID=UPI000AB8C70B
MNRLPEVTEPTVSSLPEEILAYYERGGENTRLREGAGRLEFWRAQDLLRRLLPAAPARCPPGTPRTTWCCSSGRSTTCPNARTGYGR